MLQHTEGFLAIYIYLFKNFVIEKSYILLSQLLALDNIKKKKIINRKRACTTKNQKNNRKAWNKINYTSH